MSYSINDKINLCQEQQEHHALPCSLWSHCTVGYVHRFINSWVLCFWLNTQQPIWNWALITCKNMIEWWLAMAEWCITVAIIITIKHSLLFIYLFFYRSQCFNGCKKQTKKPTKKVRHEYKLIRFVISLITLWSSIWFLYAFTASNQNWPFHLSIFENHTMYDFGGVCTSPACCAVCHGRSLFN